jgi:AcrR family transcriptional regulator
MAEGNPNSKTRQHILTTAKVLLTETNREALSVTVLCERAHIAPSTFYYYFTSFTDCLAEAERQRYEDLVASFEARIAAVELALDNGDPNVFYATVRDQLGAAWSAGRSDARNSLIRTLINIFDNKSQSARFRQQLDAQFDRWLKAARLAKERGWTMPGTTAEMVVLMFWSASVGQFVLPPELRRTMSPDAVSTFFMEILTGAVGPGSSDPDEGEGEVPET